MSSILLPTISALLLLSAYSSLAAQVRQQQALAVPSGVDTGTGESKHVYLWPGTWLNLNNQRLCLLMSVQATRQLANMGYNITLVLPSWQIASWRLTPEMMPFNYFYKTEPMQDYALAHGFQVAESLPQSLMLDCVNQMRHAGMYLADIEHWDEKSQDAKRDRLFKLLTHGGVVCLPETYSYFWSGFDMQMDKVHQVLPSLWLSDPWQRVVDKILASLSSAVGGSSDFVALHARVEEDWEASCPENECKSCHLPSGVPERCTALYQGYHCWSGPEEIADTLLNQHGVTEGTPVYVMSATPPEKLGTLCTRYKCLKKEQLLKGLENQLQLQDLRLETHLAQSFLDFQVGAQAARAFGNLYSSFSHELRHEFEARGRGGDWAWYNPRTCAEFKDN